MPAREHLARDEIHLQIADRQLRRIGHAAAPDQRADAGEQFGEREWFDQIVVCARIETGDAVFQRVARGEDQNRRLHATLAERAQNLEAVATGQRQVQEHHVECLGVDAKERPLAGALDHHVVPFILEAFAQGIGHFLFVLNDQDSHQLMKLSVRIDAMDSAAPAPGPSFSLLETMRLEHGRVSASRATPGADGQGARYFEYQWSESAVRDALAAVAHEHPQGCWRLRLLLSADGQPDDRMHTSRRHDGSLARGLRTRADRRTRSIHPPQDDTSPGLRRRQAVEDRLDDVLLWNERGEVTESTIGNVVAEIDGMRYTPPVASGLLGGTFRAEQLEAGTIRERVLTKADIASASRLWLINSVRGWVEAILVEGGRR